MQKTVTVSVCDRCGEPRPIVLKLGERELCFSCADEFDVWWAVKANHTPASRGKRKMRRLTKGDPLRIARDIIARHGHVTPREYGAATGQADRVANWSLRNLARAGVLRAVKRPHERVRYELPIAEAAE